MAVAVERSKAAIFGTRLQARNRVFGGHEQEFDENRKNYQKKFQQLIR